ncbi:hypothetical protein DAETH_33860 (plasmid) [Deinococcus aetherius]|uniref:Uncharacterized protein n=1 Tax=Deinococcus aetherius TaxID=200252 RepID=A0ABM8AI85_9DEIO|nr:hypothetical protein [Deinococcus aetherius]BDP43417.1 hypothetical protein DAETH_33860 [Deinococcus aetherius]
MRLVRPTRLPLLRRAAGLLALLALVALLLSFAVSALLTRDAALVQRVEPNAAASLFGEGDSPGTPIGSPQLMIIRDPAAFLPGEGEDGARLVSEVYLRERGLYPLQVKTVELVRNLVALGSGLAALVFGGLWLWARGRVG